VLDVAAGNGNATLAAARRWCEVTTDLVPRCSSPAGRAGRRPRDPVQEADAENLPFPDAYFDVVMSNSAMFTRTREAAARACTCL
jgi:ubiquinone/menaquinone biosynthesis C-methylase UbiE